MRFLDNVLQDFIDRAPDAASTAAYAAMRERSVGLGLMGFHSFLQSQNVPFESALAKSWNMRMFKHLRREADKASIALGEEKGPCPDAADRGSMERFSHKLAIAPTASISIICGGTSAGIEPIPAKHLRPQDPVGLVRGEEPYLEKLLEEKGQNTDSVWGSILEHEGSVQHLDFLRPGREGRLQDRLRTGSALGGRAGRRPHAGSLPRASRSTSSCRATSTSGICTCCTGWPGSAA
ncbi:hypothetical protein ACRAWD_24150 [Caulobacter segnis]